MSLALTHPFASFLAMAANAPIVRDAVQLKEAAGRTLDGFVSGDLMGGIGAFSDASLSFARMGVRFGTAAAAYVRLTGGACEAGLLERGADAVYGAGLRVRAAGASISARLAARDPKKLAANHNLLEHVDFEDRDALWSEALKELKKKDVSLPWDKIRTHDAYLRYLHTAGIRYPQRIQSIETGVMLAENGRNLSRLGKERPIAVVLSNKSDADGSFDAEEFPLLDRMVASRQFDVVYFEVDGDFEAAGALFSVYQASERKVALTVLSGHGDGRSVAFGRKRGERGDLDVDDLRTKPYLKNLLATAIAEDGQVFLDSCLSGASDVPVNLGDAFAAALPGRQIFGMRDSSNIKDIEFRDGRLTRVDFREGDSYVNCTP